MSGLLVDTCCWIEYFKSARYEEIIDPALEKSLVIGSPIIFAELLSAPLKTADRKKLTDFLDDLYCPPLARSHWYAVGAARAQLRKKGISVSTPDAHIAQVCQQQKVALLTEDKIFSKIKKYFSLQLYSSGLSFPVS